MTKTEKAVRTEQATKAIAELSGMLNPGDTVYTILRSVSRSGMRRVIDLAIVRQPSGSQCKPYIRRFGWLAAQALGYKYDRDQQGVVMGGCGMDMGFELVYNLGRVLFPGGFGELCTHSGCDYRPDNVECAAGASGIVCHESEDGLMGHKFYGRNGDRSGWDFDGGYALCQDWL